MRAPASVWPYVAFTGLTFTTGALLSKGLVDDGVDAFVVAGVPFLLAGVMGTLIALRTTGLPRRVILPAAALGVANSTMPAVLINLGFETLPAGLVTLLIAMGPVFTAVTAHFVFPDERLGMTKLAGLMLSVVGVAVLALGAESSDGETQLGGIVLVLVGVLAAGVSGVPARVLAVRHGAAVLIGPQLFAAGLVALVAAVVAGRDLVPDAGWSPVHAVGLGVLAVTGLGGFRSMMAANEIGTTGQVSVIGYLLPVLGVIGGALIFDEAITAAVVGGGALILGGVVLLGLGSRGVEAETEAQRV
ncbi:MAG: DMT family transporter [Actinomycetota bacterium]